jgi:glycosyltransferase involved in cell wall biosynthesis
MPSRRPKISAEVAIVVRTRNRPVYLRRALNSILAQTFTGWEAVIVNDGGDADAVESLVAEHAVAIDGRVRVIHHGSSRGRWPSANEGVTETSAPLVVLHDDDDSWHPEFLERAVDYLAAHPDANGVVSRIEIVWEERSGDDVIEVEREPFMPFSTDPLLSDAMLFNRFVPIAFVYRRRLHERVGPFRESLVVVGDWEFNIRALAAGPLEYLGDEAYAYWHQRRDHDGTDGNSVIAHAHEHEKYDARVRDDAFRAYVEEAGPGLALYLTSFIDRRFVEVEQGIRQEIAHLRHESIHTKIGRAASAFRSRFRRR